MLGVKLSLGKQNTTALGIRTVVSITTAPENFPPAAHQMNPSVIRRIIGVVPETNPCCVKKILKQTAVNGKSGMKNAAVATAPVMVVAIEAIVHFVVIQILQLVARAIVYHQQIHSDCLMNQVQDHMLKSKCQMKSIPNLVQHLLQGVLSIALFVSMNLVLKASLPKEITPRFFTGI